MLRRFILMFFVSSLVTSVASADELTKEKIADIKQLMEVTGAGKIASQFGTAMSQQMFQILKSTRPDLPERALVVMEQELTSLLTEKMAAPGGLIDIAIPIYGKHFSHAEIRELLAFYETPIGKKSIEVLPAVMNESVAAGQEWGQKLGPEIRERVLAALKREGLLAGPH